jgi:hypothetical protein
MATLAVVQPSIAGVSVGAVAAAGGGDKFLNDGSVLLYVKNGSVAPITVTVEAAGTPGGLSFTDPAYVVAAGNDMILGAFNPQYFNDATGFVNLTYSGVTTLTVSPIKAR